MNLADVNVLLAAFRKGHRDHPQCSAWVDVQRASPRYGIAPQVLSSVLRIATSTRIFPDPSPLADVLAFAEQQINAPNAIIVRPGPRHWSIFLDLVRDTQARGDRVPDAWFAALAIEHGCIWVTLDRGFARFKGLTTKTP